MKHSRQYNQVMRVMSGEHIEDIRRRLERRYRRREMRRKLRNLAQDLAYYGGTLIAATICAFAYIAAIAVLCGY